MKTAAILPHPSLLPAALFAALLIPALLPATAGTARAAGLPHSELANLTRCWCLQHAGYESHRLLDGIVSAAAEDAPDLLQPPDAPPSLVRRAGDAEWRLWRLNPGTRSEGSHGRLWVDGKEVVGAAEGEETRTGLGAFVWRGSFADRRRLWDDSGWQPADPDGEE